MGWIPLIDWFHNNKSQCLPRRLFIPRTNLVFIDAIKKSLELRLKDRCHFFILPRKPLWLIYLNLSIENELTLPSLIVSIWRNMNAIRDVEVWFLIIRCLDDRRNICQVVCVSSTNIIFGINTQIGEECVYGSSSTSLSLPLLGFLYFSLSLALVHRERKRRSIHVETDERGFFFLHRSCWQYKKRERARENSLEKKSTTTTTSGSVFHRDK